MDTKSEPKPATPAVETTPEAQNELQRAMFERLGIPQNLPSSEIKEPVEAKKPDAAPVEAVKPEAAPQAVKSVSKKKKPEPIQVAPTVDANTIAAAAASAAVAAVKSSSPAVEPVKPASFEELLNPDEKKKLAVLKRMEQLNPATSGIAQKFVSGIEKLRSYRKDWQDKHKGVAFNPADDEHNEFFAENDTQYDEPLYLEAMADLKAEEKLKPIQDKISERERQEQMAQRAFSEQKLVESHRSNAAKAMFNSIGGEFVKVLDENGNPVSDVVQKISSESPAAQIVFNVADNVERVSAELVRIARGHVDFNPNLPLHQRIFDFANQQEQAMKRLPADKQVDANGRKFATTDEWSAMSPEQRRLHWHFSDRDLSLLYADEAATFAKKSIEDFEKNFNATAERRGLKPAATAKSAEPQQTKAEIKVPDVVSPAGNIAPILSSAPKGGSTEEIPLMKRMFG